MKPPMGWLAVTFLGLFYAVGFVLLGIGVWAAYRSTAAGRWPTAPGTLTRLDLAKQSGEDEPTYEVKVAYRYEVAGVVYEGDRLAFGYGASSGRDAHEQIHRKLAAAAGVEVRYKPSDPAESCLSFGLHRAILMTFAFAGTWLAFVAGFTALYWLHEQGDSVLLRNLGVK